MRIAFLNPQGNFDPKDSYWGKHPDFGGQLVYVKELARSMAGLGVEVDIVTRRIVEPDWPEFSSRFDHYDDISNVRIVRVDFGGKCFIPKEHLWPHLGEYVDSLLELYASEGSYPDFITGHYGDGGISAVMILRKRGIPYTFTAHSLGARKLENLLKAHVGALKELDRTYNFSIRISAERVAMKYSAKNIASTRSERHEQYSHPVYKGWIDVDDDSRFRIIPPGVNTRIFTTQSQPHDAKVREKVEAILNSRFPKHRHDLPWIIASSRLDPKKNHLGLVKAFASNKELQSLANLVIVTRGVDVYNNAMGAGNVERRVISKILEVVKAEHLDEKVSFLNIEGQSELASLYRLGAERNSVFALTTFHEPFGLAIIEAMACGLVVIATKNGGPSEILQEDGAEYGILVDPINEKDIARGLLEALSNPSRYTELQERGIERVMKRYTWEMTAKSYLETINEIINLPPAVSTPEIPDYFFGQGKPPVIPLERFFKDFREGQNFESSQI